MDFLLGEIMSFTLVLSCFYTVHHGLDGGACPPCPWTIAYHGQWAMQSSKDTKRKRKSTRFECFWPNEWTRPTASEQMYLHRAQRADRKVVRLPQAVDDAIVQGHEKTKKKHSL